MHGEHDKENTPSLIGVESDSARQPGGVKRPSDTPLQRNRKKSQEEATHGSRRRRHRREEEKGKEDKKREKKEERSRRKSKEYGIGEHPTKFRDAFRESTKTDEGEKREEIGQKPAEECRRSRRRESKYEEAREINIPVRIMEAEQPDKIYRPQVQHEPKVCNIHIERESDDVLRKALKKENGSDRSERRNSDGVLGVETKPNKRSHRRRSYPQRKLDQNDDEPLTLNLERDREINPIHELSESETENNESNSNYFQSREESKNSSRPRDCTQHDPSSVHSPSTISTHFRTSENLNKIPKLEESVIAENTLDEVDGNQTNHTGELNGSLETSKNTLDAPKLSTRRSSSPISPGSRLVKVEEDSSLKEDCIFKDCWSDFSNTLQDVLARLQELSSELGQSKILATTPSSEELPHFPQEVSIFSNKT